MNDLKYLITLPTSISSALASTSKICYRCGKQDHYAHQCITLSTTDYLQYRYKFGRLGDVVERVTKSQSQSEDDLYPGYNSDTETKTATTTTTTTNNGRPPLPRGARGARGGRGGSSKPRGPRPPRPPPKKRPSIVKKKIKKLSAKQIAAEEKMKAAFDLATQNETKADQDQINKWKNEDKLEVETRTCPRTKRKVRIDMWDAHVSALSGKFFLQIEQERLLTLPFVVYQKEKDKKRLTVRTSATSLYLIFSYIFVFIFNFNFVLISYFFFNF